MVRLRRSLFIMVTGSELARVSARACPFCGLATDVPHESQEGCIEALQVEIARVREILQHLRPLDDLASPLKRPNGGAD
jgi:hypothetical protein